MGEPKTRTTAAGSPTHLQAVRQIGLTHTYLHTHTHAGSVCVCVCECVSAYGSRTQRTIAKCERCLIQVRAFLGQLLYLYRYLYLCLCLPPNTCVCVCVCTVCVFVWGSGSRPRPPPLSSATPLRLLRLHFTKKWYTTDISHVYWPRLWLLVGYPCWILFRILCIWDTFATCARLTRIHIATWASIMVESIPFRPLRL